MKRKALEKEAKGKKNKDWRYAKSVIFSINYKKLLNI
jgi:hypothetical protein